MNSDHTNWNKRYQAEQDSRPITPRTLLVEQNRFLPASGFALDVATGMGGSAAYLHERGLKVIAIDSSSEAIKRAKARLPEVAYVLADLNEIVFPERKFDVITNFYYFNRKNWLRFSDLIKPGGVIFIECLTQEIRQIKPAISPERLLEKGELRRIFANWETLFYREGWIPSEHGTQKAVASLVARFPAG
jgi:2-polyprenyl-3-methyl-5-hydroxy-6-metoxy-1,4-benzoquinol methylase